MECAVITSSGKLFQSAVAEGWEEGGGVEERKDNWHNEVSGSGGWVLSMVLWSSGVPSGPVVGSRAFGACAKESAAV